MRPLTPAESALAVDNMHASIARHGLWNKVCLSCGASIGGRLAEYGEPHPDDLAKCACPNCHSTGARAEFVPAKTPDS